MRQGILADLTIPECLDDSAAHKTAFSIKQTLSDLPSLFSFLCIEIAVAAPKTTSTYNNCMIHIYSYKILDIYI